MLPARMALLFRRPPPGALLHYHMAPFGNAVVAQDHNMLRSSAGHHRLTPSMLTSSGWAALSDGSLRVPAWPRHPVHSTE